MICMVSLTALPVRTGIYHAHNSLKDPECLLPEALPSTQRQWSLAMLPTRRTQAMVTVMAMIEHIAFATGSATER